ncbi:MAG: glycosyltransferase, partial [Gemmatimonadales bacterium]
VLHVIAPAAFGGLEQVVLQLAAGRVARRMPTEVLALLSDAEAASAPPLVEALARSEVRVTVLRSAHQAYREERRGIFAAVSAYGADVVHTHGYHPDVLTRSPAREAGSGLVSTAHGFTGGGLKNKAYEWLQRRAWREFDVVAAVSRPLRDRLVSSGIPENVVELCPNAWSGAEPLERAAARERLGLPASPRFVGWIGRLSDEKGPDVMVRALTRLPGDIGAVMIGDGQARGELTDLSRELGVSARITWAGPIQGAGACMAAFDAFALSSRTEGTPMVLFEAMAARTPIVATSVGGVPDVVSPTEAMLVEPESPEALARGIESVLSDPTAAARRTSAARRRLDEKYSLAPWLDRYEEFYARAAGRRRSPPPLTRTR